MPVIVHRIKSNLNFLRDTVFDKNSHPARFRFNVLLSFDGWSEYVSNRSAYVRRVWRCNDDIELDVLNYTQKPSREIIIIFIFFLFHRRDDSTRCWLKTI